MTTTEQCEPLSAMRVPNAVVSPIQNARMEPRVLHLGVFDEAGEILHSSVEDRHDGSHLYAAADLSIYPDIPSAAEPAAIYAGVFFNHFGHFLLESLARLWYARAHPDLPIVWVGVDSWTSSPALKSWQREILDILEIRNPVRVLVAAERFEDLHVPDAGYKYADWCHPQHAEFLAVFDGAAQIPGRRVWLSRSDVGNGVGMMNGGMIEDNVRKSGWLPVRPERLTVREQLTVLAEAEEVAGEEGSAFHLLLLLADVSSKQFHVFRRYGFEHKSFHTIGKARAVNQHFYTTDRDVVISVAGREVQRLAPNARQVLDALRAPLHKSTIKSVEGHHSLRRINDIVAATKAKSYLEVGLKDGSIFRWVDCEQKVGIDSPLEFDPRRFPDSTSDFYSASPHDFAAYFAGRRVFDLVFINNCHSPAEVLRTVMALLPLTHARTVMVIDNAIPIDEIASLMSSEDALGAREIPGRMRDGDQGDVFNAVLLLRALLPAWKLLTFGTEGIPQAVFVAPGARPRYEAAELAPTGFLDQVADLAQSDRERMRQLGASFGVVGESDLLRFLRSAFA